MGGKSQLAIRHQKTAWGGCYFFSAKEYQFALYYYHNEPKTLYLANVEVYLKHRSRGFGNIILNKAEHFAKKYKMSKIFLKYLKTSWAGNWYKRHGYQYYNFDKNDKYIWLIKEIA